MDLGNIWGRLSETWGAFFLLCSPRYRKMVKRIDFVSSWTKRRRVWMRLRRDNDKNTTP
jgi:hypothetical protein